MLAKFDFEPLRWPILNPRLRKIPANVRAVQAQVAHTPCPATRLLHPGIHPESSVHCNCTCNRGSAKIGCTVLCGSPPYPFLASKPNRIRCSTRLACFFGQRAIRRGLLPRLVYPVVFIRGFHHRTCLMQACAQMRNRVHAITGHHAHTVQASVLTVLVFVVPQSATPLVQLLNRFRVKQGPPHLPPLHVAWVCKPSSVRRRLMLASAI